MMNAWRRRFPQLGPWLALLLLVGQVLAQVHATQHELGSPASHVSCDICILAHGAGGPPAPIGSAILHPRQTPYLAAELPARIARQTLDRPRSRAPPVLI